MVGRGQPSSVPNKFAAFAVALHIPVGTKALDDGGVKIETPPPGKLSPTPYNMPSALMNNCAFVPAVVDCVVMVHVEVHEAVFSQPVAIDALPADGDCDQMAVLEDAQ